MLDSLFMRRTWAETMLALAVIANIGRGIPSAERIVPLNTKRLVRGRPHQGKQEMARRRRQIASGMLRQENGLVASQPI